MPLPNLVIAGAPKCGTSSLFSWLVDHPDVCGSTVKEPFFLMDSDNPLRSKACNVHDHGLAAYSSFFSDCGKDDAIIVEATTHYLYQDTALDVLESLQTGPRVLFLLRKPSERVYSSFGYSKSKGYVRDGLSFSEFLRIVAEEGNSEEVEQALGPSAYVLSRDVDYSCYATYLERWRDRLGPERMHILLFEDLRADPGNVMRELCRWIGISESFYEDYDFSARNRTVPIRSRALQKLARSITSLLPGGALKAYAKRGYLALQSKRRAVERTVEDELALAELEKSFESCNARLAGEFGLNLDAWK